MSYNIHSKIKIIVLAVIATISISACVKDLDQAEECIQLATEAFQVGDTDRFYDYFDNPTEMKEEFGDLMLSSESNTELINLIKESECTVRSVEIKNKVTTAMVEIQAYNFEIAYEEALTEYSNIQNELIKNQDDEKIKEINTPEYFMGLLIAKTKEIDKSIYSLEVELTKNDKGEYKIINNKEFINKMQGYLTDTLLKQVAIK